MFAALSKDATDRNVETLGVLLGKVDDTGVRLVSHLFVPQQTGDANSCEATTIGSMSQLYFTEREDLCLFGWIHVRGSLQH
jgi:hypothetical protein